MLVVTNFYCHNVELIWIEVKIKNCSDILRISFSINICQKFQGLFCGTKKFWPIYSTSVGVSCYWLQNGTFLSPLLNKVESLSIKLPDSDIWTHGTKWRIYQVRLFQRTVPAVTLVLLFLGINIYECGGLSASKIPSCAAPCLNAVIVTSSKGQSAETRPEITESIVVFEVLSSLKGG